MKGIRRLLIVLTVIFVLLLILFIAGPFYIIKEGEMAVVVRFGAVIAEEKEAGLKLRLPFVDTVVRYPQKLLSWDGEAITMPTAENQLIWVDTTARWKIVNPQRFYTSVTTTTDALDRLDGVIDSAVRSVISENQLQEAVRDNNQIISTSATDPVLEDEQIEDIQALRELTRSETRVNRINKGREQLSVEMVNIAKQNMHEYGIELIDIVVRQIRYSDNLTRSVYDRMIADRNQVAQAYRSYGEGRKAEQIGKLENDKRRIISEAYREAEQIRGDADAEAAQVYAEAYQQDSEFFKFWRTLESYKNVLNNFDATLTTDPEYFDYLYNR